ncbi:protein-disulfide reductase DsbD family protein [Edaphobacter modestus]|uniref:Thiol:disulfide interchange protein DsbD n=1 Tax=Edaphobacter modestus TaxID=388466 RepID=A0A4Q7XXM8_9BACT|nr:thioredoxin family protein [Edaphobacter modestus]RZU29060.1 thiol:disulfide interchange protein DsbD [Edaphobacter modestus]
MRTRIFAWVILVFPSVLGLSALSTAQMPSVSDGGPGPVHAPHITVELVFDSQTIAPGGLLQAGLHLTPEDHWHVYWINAGDSGQPPRVTWDLPDGITAGAMQFPAPTRLPLGPLTDFGYENSVIFPIQINAASNVKPRPAHLGASVRWLVCREICVPGKAQLGLDVTVGPGAQATRNAVLSQAVASIPKQLPAGMNAKVIAGKQDMVVVLATGISQSHAEFYPYDSGQIVNAANQVSEPLPDGVSIRLKRAEDLTTLPDRLHGIVTLGNGTAFEVQAAVAPGEVPIKNKENSSTRQGTPLTAIGAIALAFVGGVILNLMPCVFPVLFLKGLALVSVSGEERRQLRAHGAIYTAGILVSFWAIVATLLVLRAGGSQAGWGFQLQSPVFVVLLASGLFFFSLSLAGQFDIGLSLTSAGGGLAQKSGFAGTFFTGVLATVVATPCTGPLMGVAIGFALTQSPTMTFAIFSALALGLAAPYLLLSFQPQLSRLLPRPGAWMETFKQATAAVFFLTVIWLTYVYGRLFISGTNATLSVYRISMLLACFLALAIAGWCLGKWPAQRKGTIAATLIALLGLYLPLHRPKDIVAEWQPYSKQALEQARATGHPVFIDFTAAWCLSCQVNERLVLRSKEVQDEFAARHMTLLKADWTQYDPQITTILTELRRSGVPTYVLYQASADTSPHVLPELLTKSVVLDALALPR